ncbi:PRPF4 [Cordylochernes scorpioides]|uniref:PRPF4 n=1 Tax=Cordylochernes scorpioides TaxID=51811 RepID=A0ABY6KP09_9ARAC|nr:PRPF4 [Cordylochernes scorpioides]
MELEEDNASKERQILLQEFERRKKARHINVSTDDNEVKATLRQLREPICKLTCAETSPFNVCAPIYAIVSLSLKISLFGEGPADRRERLRQLFANLGDESLVQHKKVQKLERPLEKDKEVGSRLLTPIVVMMHSIQRDTMMKLDKIIIDKGISFKTKEKNIETLVFSLVTYGCESRTLRKEERKRI